jgi:hypothetical protein
MKDIERSMVHDSQFYCKGVAYAFCTTRSQGDEGSMMIGFLRFSECLLLCQKLLHATESIHGGSANDSVSFLLGARQCCDLFS